MYSISELSREQEQWNMGACSNSGVWFEFAI